MSTYDDEHTTTTTKEKLALNAALLGLPVRPTSVSQQVWDMMTDRERQMIADHERVHEEVRREMIATARRRAFLNGT